MKRPRLWETTPNIGANKQEIAFHLGMSVSQFDVVRARLEAEGMPKPDPITKTWCVPAVDQWWMARHGLAIGDELSAVDSDLGERIKQWQPQSRRR